MIYRYFYIFLAIVVLFCFSPAIPQSTCVNCHPTVENKINVHLIPHSHDDVGWLKTVDEYYYGVQNNIQKGSVQYIISSVVSALKSNPDRRFIQVETAFLWMWWRDQNDAVKQDFIDLVNNGQIEIVNGAWSQNDEAVVHYQSVIDQFTWGLRFLNDSIGTCARPKIGWQIDPFGHSREHASLISQMGFKGLFFARLSERDRERRQNDSAMNLVWRASQNLNGTDIFTYAFPYHYDSPPGLCFDMLCNDSAIVTDRESPAYNVPTKVQDFVDFVNEVVPFYNTKHILLTIGGDFQYQAAEMNYINIDRFLNAMKDHETINVIYSTPSCFVKAVNEAATEDSIKMELKTDDFLPYAETDHRILSGFFTSRPILKGFERYGNKILQAAKQLTVLGEITGNYSEGYIEGYIDDLRRTMGVLQHHDAITGTERIHVRSDYIRLLKRGIYSATTYLGEIISNVLRVSDLPRILELRPCFLSNISICEQTRQDNFVVAVYNPLSRNVTHYVRLPVSGANYIVRGPDGEEIVDLLEAIDNFTYIEHEHIHPRDLVFVAKDIPPFGVKLYHVEETENTRPIPKTKPNLGNDNTQLSYDPETNKLTITMNGITIQMRQEFSYYGSWSEDDDDAYSFRPSFTRTYPYSRQNVSQSTGQLVDEIREEYDGEVKLITRLYKGTNESFIEFDWFVGNLTLEGESSLGKNLITRYTIDDFLNNGVFYTDSNGREMMKRELNKRADFDYNIIYEPVSSNYYPVTSKIVIKDENLNLQAAVLTDRAEGGTSLSNGTIELMLLRALYAGGVMGEVMYDQEFGQGVFARGQHYFTFGPTETSAVYERDLALKKLLSPLVLVGDHLTFEELTDNFELQFSGLQRELPRNVHLLTLEPWINSSYLLRLEHILEKNEDSELSQDVTINLQGLFTFFDVESIRETTLAANQWLDEYDQEEKYVWLTDQPTTTWQRKEAADPLEITLSPMQIRTYVINTLSKRS